MFCKCSGGPGCVEAARGVRLGKSRASPHGPQAAFCK